MRSVKTDAALMRRQLINLRAVGPRSLSLLVHPWTLPCILLKFVTKTAVTIIAARCPEQDKFPPERFPANRHDNASNAMLAAVAMNRSCDRLTKNGLFD
jgi:hypothetical protein